MIDNYLIINKDIAALVLQKRGSLFIVFDKILADRTPTKAVSTSLQRMGKFTV